VNFVVHGMDVFPEKIIFVNSNMIDESNQVRQVVVGDILYQHFPFFGSLIKCLRGKHFKLKTVNKSRAEEGNDRSTLNAHLLVFLEGRDSAQVLWSVGSVLIASLAALVGNVILLKVRLTHGPFEKHHGEQ